MIQYTFDPDLDDYDGLSQGGGHFVLLAQRADAVRHGEPCRGARRSDVAAPPPWEPWECPADSGAHGGHLVFTTEGNGVRYELSLHGLTDLNAGMLRGVVESMHPAISSTTE